MRLTREGLQRLRHRHPGYRLMPAVEIAVLALLPLAQRVACRRSRRSRTRAWEPSWPWPER